MSCGSSVARTPSKHDKAPVWLKLLMVMRIICFGGMHGALLMFRRRVYGIQLIFSLCNLGF